MPVFKMNTKKDDILITQLKKLNPDHPGIDFTEEVMEQLQLHLEQELSADSAFKNSIGLDVETLSKDFTNNLLLAINKKKSKRVKPVISSKTAWLFAVTMAVLVALSFLVNGQQTTTNKTYDLNIIYKLFDLSSQSVTILFMCIVSLSALMLIEYTFKNRWSF